MRSSILGVIGADQLPPSWWGRKALADAAAELRAMVIVSARLGWFLLGEPSRWRFTALVEVV